MAGKAALLSGKNSPHITNDMVHMPMPEISHRIKKAFLVPLSIDVALLLLLLVLSWVTGTSSLERGVLCVLFLTALLVLAEAGKRAITIVTDGLRIRKFFKIKELLRSDITHIGCMIVRSRVYLLLTTKKGFYVISNAYERFPELIRALIELIPPETVEIEEEVRAQIDRPVHNRSDLIAAWVAAAVLTGIVCLKLIS
jgi:hypothetical protein